MRYKTKLVEIEAFLWEGGDEIIKWANNISDGNGTSIQYEKMGTNELLIVCTLEGVMQANRGDYVICGLEGEFYFCKPEIFMKKYEPVPCEPKHRTPYDKLTGSVVYNEDGEDVRYFE